MSGQLVGEVLAAADELRDRGLTPRGFYALIAIAEKASTHNRQASVPWKHIRAGLYGASPSTAKRAISDLKAAGLVRVLRRGFDNQNGRVEAPIYEIQPIGEQVTQVTQSGGGRTGHPGDPIATDRTGHLEDRTGHISDRTGHPGDLLNGSTNGSTNGGRARVDDPAAGGTSPTPQQSVNGKTWTRGRFGPRCLRPDHVDNPNPGACGGCKEARIASEQDAVAEQAKKDRERKAIRQAVDNCRTCSGTGQIDLAEDLVGKCPDCSTEDARQRIINELTARPAS